jgi:hypothetical protein
VNGGALLAGAGVLALVAFTRARSRASVENGAGAPTGDAVTGRVAGRYALSEADADAFYADVLLALGMPASANRLRFMRAWRQAEGAEATWNPWNTTWSRGRASRYNSVGVGNYATRADGLAASAGTLRLRYYTDLRARLARDDAPELVALSPDLRTWGTGAGVSRVLAAFPAAIPYRTPLFGV